MGKFKESWKSLVAWWASNLKSNEKKISTGFSWLLVIMISNLLPPVIAMLKGGTADWNTYFIVVIVALISFTIMIIEAIFGRKQAPPPVTPEIIT